MNDEFGLEENSSSQPEDARIRALLAELGSGPDGQPVPPEVAARLDDTLARLVTERASHEGAKQEDAAGSVVVPLRRRWLPRATAAAAAVIVVGAGGVAAANLGIFGNDPSMSSGGGGSQVAESAPEPTVTSPGSKGLIDEDSGREATGALVALPQIRGSSFATDVTALLQRRTATDLAGEAPATGSDSGGDAAGTPDLDTPEDTPERAKQAPSNALKARNCAGPEITDGAVPNPIRYDGQLAVLVIHPESEGQRLVEAWNCAGDRRLASTTVTP